MMSHGGFYLMHRGWMDHPVLATNEPFSRREAWVWLIENAAFTGRRVRTGATIIELHRGQLTASTRFLGKAWGWSEARVRRFLTCLKIDAMIDAATDAGQTVITLCNYEIYQTEQLTADAHSDAGNDAQATQERRKIEIREIKEIESIGHQQDEKPFCLKTDEQPPAKQPPFEQWWGLTPLKVGKGQARKAFTVALRKATLEQLSAGIRRYAQAVDGREQRFICHPATWLNGERWLDNLSDAEGDAHSTNSTTDVDFDLEYRAALAKGANSPEFTAFLAKHHHAPTKGAGVGP